MSFRPFGNAANFGGYSDHDSRQDLTSYGDGELSLHVFNDENLYLDRHHANFVDSLEQIFRFTQDQRDELVTDLAEDLSEE